MIDDDSIDDDEDDDVDLAGWAATLRAELPEEASTGPSKKSSKLQGEEAVRAKLLLEIADEKDRMTERGEVDFPVDRPVTRADCAPWIRPVDGAQNHDRPCPWASCRHHLALHISRQTGAIEPLQPGVEIWEMAETCALDLAERGGEPGSGLGPGKTLGEVGALFGVTRERIRQVELKATNKIKRGRGVNHLLVEQATEAGLLDPPPRTKRRLPLIEEPDEDEDEHADR